MKFNIFKTTFFIFLFANLFNSAQATITPGHYQSGWVDGQGRIGSDLFPDRKVNVFVKSIAAKTNLSTEQNYYAFVVVELDKDPLEQSVFGAFQYLVNVYRVEEIQKDLQFWYPVKHDGATISIDYINPIQVRAVDEDGEIKLKFQADDVNFEASLKNDFIWANIFPTKTKQYLQDDREDLQYDLSINASSITGMADIPFLLGGQTSKVEKFNSSMVLNQLFSGVSVAKKIVPNATARKGVSLGNELFVTVVPIRESKNKYSYYLFSMNQAGKLFPALRVSREK